MCYLLNTTNLKSFLIFSQPPRPPYPTHWRRVYRGHTGCRVPSKYGVGYLVSDHRVGWFDIGRFIGGSSDDPIAQRGTYHHRCSRSHPARRLVRGLRAHSLAQVLFMLAGLMGCVGF
jgi:hypothetical protein